MLIERILGMRFRDKEAGDAGNNAGGNGADNARAGAAGAANDAKGAGQGGGAAADGGSGTGGAAAGGAADGGAAGKKSLLETLGKGSAGAAGDGGSAGKAGEGEDGKGQTPEQKALAAAEKDTRRPTHIPAKYWDAEKGEIRTEAMAKSVSSLEKRMRDVGLPPESVEGYKFELPKELKDAGVELDPKLSTGFRSKALELGLTQKQYEGVMGAYMENLAAVADQTSQLSFERAQSDLLAYYKTEDALKQAVGRAFKTFEAFADEKDAEMIDVIGNIPAVIRILDKVGKEMAEDPGVHPDAILDGESLEHLMRGAPGKEDSPYWNADDPRHKSVKAKVQAHHEARAATNRRKAA